MANWYCSVISGVCVVNVVEFSQLTKMHIIYIYIYIYIFFETTSSTSASNLEILVILFLFVASQHPKCVKHHILTIEGHVELKLAGGYLCRVDIFGDEKFIGDTHFGKFENYGPICDVMGTKGPK